MSEVANPLEHQHVYDERGETIALRSLWQSQPVVLVADFADQQDVLVPHDYVSISTLHDSLATNN